MKGRKTVLVLGAGASRGVSYAKDADFPSPLDFDFFDLLQRLEPSVEDAKAVTRVLDRVNLLPREYWRAFERSFYTLQLKAYLSKKLEFSGHYETDERVVTDFALCVHALLRKAHGRTSLCTSHRAILSVLEPCDSIITFNYDLVIERALKLIALNRSIRFSPSLYGFRASSTRRLPLLLKLHGSSNWRLVKSKDGKVSSLQVRTERWEDFDRAPGYVRISKRETTAFPIFLPFWDKRIERKPWVDLWKNALGRLSDAESLLVWGYSLPPTDVKAQVLFNLGLTGRKINLCVVDPSQETRARWRNLFPNARFWEYERIEGFPSCLPDWFQES